MKQRITFDTVRELAGELAGAEESTSYGTPAFKVRGTLFFRLWEDNETLVVRTEMDRREEMISDDQRPTFLPITISTIHGFWCASQGAEKCPPRSDHERMDARKCAKEVVEKGIR
jgi:hypothetical protein